MKLFRSLVVMVVLAAALAGAPRSAPASSFASECLPPSDEPTVTVGAVECQRIHSEHVGGVTAFSYYVPPSCAPALGRRCPVVYFLHGTGGSYREGVGTKGTAGNAWVRAVDSGPRVDPRSVPDPWNHSNPSTWVPKPALDLILVSPHGLTVPGGHGPAPGVDTGWADWNPKYAQGGAYERYPTPPPRVESFVVDELLPYVDRHFPTGDDREWRFITGKSQGGFGSFAIGLAHPDLFSGTAMLSGGGFPFPPLLAEGTDVPEPVQVAPALALPYVPAPGPVPLLVPPSLYPTTLVSEVSVGFGDPVVDNVWWRKINPIDLQGNARAWSDDGRQSLYLKYHVNDAVPRRVPADLQHPNYALNQGFESVLFPMDLYMERVFDRLGVERTFHVGPGLHNNDPYQQPYYREHLEAYAAHLRLPDGTGQPPPRADRFDYRTIDTDFRIWGWRFAVDREPVEFLFLSDVTCDSLTLRGSGSVTVRVPGRCRTGVGGERTFTVDLGPSQPVDEPAGAGSVEAYGRRVTVELTALR